MRVLVLGGSEFMGRHVVDVLLARSPGEGRHIALLRLPEREGLPIDRDLEDLALLPLRSTRDQLAVLLLKGDDVTVLNRGNVYWEPQSASLKRIKCNREDRAAFTQTLRNSGKWDAVIDFSSFNAMDMKASVEGLQGLVTTYVYISSDSVYMVCKAPSHNGTRKEEDAIRPEDPQQRKRLNDADSYGDGKLQCEEVLATYPNFPHVSLRLPDVFGPYDTTNRHWKYQLWLAASNVSPVYIGNETAGKKLGFVYRDDVTIAALTAIRLGPAVHGKAFNIACSEQPTLKEYLTLCAEFMGIKPQLSADVKHVEFLPSVDFGPIDISRALNTLTGWKPTPLAEAVKQTIAFFETAWARYPQMRPRLKGPLKKDPVKAAIAQRYERPAAK